jgi:hypothetical protein
MFNHLTAATMSTIDDKCFSAHVDKSLKSCGQGCRFTLTLTITPPREPRSSEPLRLPTVVDYGISASRAHR